MSSTELKPIRIDLSAGLALPGAARVSMTLLYNPLSEPLPVSGQVLITQAIAGPASHILINHVAGELHALGFQQGHRVLRLEGTYQVALPPPVIGELTQKFSALIVVDNDWVGHGSFRYGSHTLTDVPVQPAPQA